MGKPDWQDAPEWANHLAMDASGAWWWYEYEPTLDAESWNHSYGRARLAIVRPWNFSHERRP